MVHCLTVQFKLCSKRRKRRSGNPSIASPGHFQKYGVFQLLGNSGYDITLGYLVYSSAPGVDWCCYGFSYFQYSFESMETGYMTASVEPGRKRQRKGAACVEQSLLATHMVFLKGESMSLPAEKLTGCQ